MTNLPKTRREAIELGAKRYFTGKPCKRGHVTWRYASCNKCKDCSAVESDLLAERRRDARKINPRFARQRAGAAGEKTYFTGRTCKYGHVSDRYVHNGTCLECYKDRARKAYNDNPGKMIAKARDWENKNPGRRKYHRRKSAAQHKAARLQRTPAWANLEAIKRVYQDCPQDHQVDHIVPLQGANVSGLHVEYNLQYLPKSENASKGNRWNPTIEVFINGNRRGLATGTDR